MRFRKFSGAGTRTAPLLALLLSLAGCDASPIAWDQPPRAEAGAAVSEAHAAALPARPAPDSIQGAEGVTSPPPSPAGLAACPESVRGAGRGRERFAAWWAARPDSSAVLLAAYSTDSGATWARVIPVDTLDRSVRGCARPAPAIAADGVNGYVHTVYFLEAPEGAGLFYAHLMDPRASFEPPGAIVYGDRPSAASVASAGDTVVVAYEDPNNARSRVELALSRSGGHVFDERYLDVSSGDVSATDPRAAVEGGGRVAVSWTEGGRRVVRTGRVR